eukprot:gene18478-24191_t
MSGRSITLRIKLSKLLSLIGNYSDALEELHLCSSICAMNEQDSDVVNQELEKLENLIRGNIPDEASRSFIDINDNHNDGTPADDDDDDGDIPSGRQSSRYNPSYSRSRVSSAISYRRNVRTPNRSITFDDEEDDDRPSGDGLLAIACWNDRLEIAEMLIDEFQADVNARNKSHLTPLHRACYQGFEKIIRLLCSKGADLFAKDDNGITPGECGSEDVRMYIQEKIKIYKAIHELKLKEMEEADREWDRKLIE